MVCQATVLIGAEKMKWVAYVSRYEEAENVFITTGAL